MLPANKRRGSPTGGGNFYVFKQAKPEQQAAALKFIKWITSPARAAQWGIDTGYVAVRPDAWETPAMKKYVADFPPAAVARDQLQYAVAELSTHDNQRVTKALNDGLQAALTGTKPAAPGHGRRATRSRSPPAPVSASRALGTASSPFSSAERWRGQQHGCNSLERHRMTRTPQWLYGWLLLLPAAALLALFTHYPAVATLWHSFLSTPKGARPAVFVGIDNYQQLVDDPIFWQALTNNLWYAAGTIPLAIALALMMAVWVNGKLAGRGFLRLAYFTPTVLPMIAVANIWLFFYTPGYGLLEQITGAFGLPSHNWLGSKSTALTCLMVVTVWKEAGFFMIFYLAALQQMSPHLAEAAAIEGASRWYFFRRVTFPLLMPTTLFVLVNAVINAFRLVDHVVVMTRGGPDNATELLLYYIYEVGFRFWDSAYAAALTMVLLLLLGIAALVQFAFLERKVHYQ